MSVSYVSSNVTFPVGIATTNGNHDFHVDGYTVCDDIKLLTTKASTQYQQRHDDDHKKQHKPRRRLLRACNWCRIRHHKCSGIVPCERCVADDCADQCRISDQKTRGRKRKYRPTSSSSETLLTVFHSDAGDQYFSGVATISIETTPTNEDPPNQGCYALKRPRRCYCSVSASTDHSTNENVSSISLSAPPLEILRTAPYQHPSSASVVAVDSSIHQHAVMDDCIPTNNAFSELWWPCSVTPYRFEDGSCDDALYHWDPVQAYIQAHWASPLRSTLPDASFTVGQNECTESAETLSMSSFTTIENNTVSCLPPPTPSDHVGDMIEDSCSVLWRDYTAIRTHEVDMDRFNQCTTLHNMKLQLAIGNVLQ